MLKFTHILMILIGLTFADSTFFDDPGDTFVLFAPQQNITSPGSIGYVTVVNATNITSNITGESVTPQQPEADYAPCAVIILLAFVLYQTQKKRDNGD